VLRIDTARQRKERHRGTRHGAIKCLGIDAAPQLTSEPQYYNEFFKVRMHSVGDAGTGGGAAQVIWLLDDREEEELNKLTPQPSNTALKVYCIVAGQL
jgi:hypothetical protein